MIVDLDAHQGNGHENDKLSGLYNRHHIQVYTFDMYNASIYPYDINAREAIDSNIPLKSHTNTQTYLSLLKQHLPTAILSFQPQCIILSERNPMIYLRSSLYHFADRLWNFLFLFNDFNNIPTIVEFFFDAHP